MNRDPEIPYQGDLPGFQFDAPEVQNKSLVSVALIMAQTPLQKEFAKLIKKIEGLQDKISGFGALQSEFSAQHNSIITPLNEQINDCVMQIVEKLHAYLQQPKTPKSWSKKLRNDAKKMTVRLIEQYLSTEDPKIRAIYDAYSTQSTDQLDKESIEDMRDFARYMGLDTSDLGDNADSDAVYEEVMRKMLEKNQKEQEKSEERKEKRRRAKAQLKQEGSLDNEAQKSAAEDAALEMRQIYRQLAQQLHPDRANNDTQRALHHDLMSSVNEAYDRSDLLALLKLQLKVQQVHMHELPTQADERLKNWINLLKKQVKDLNHQARNEELRLILAFELPVFSDVNRANLQHDLDEKRKHFESILFQMKAEIAAIINDDKLKAWLENQKNSFDAEYDIFS